MSMNQKQLKSKDVDHLTGNLDRLETLRAYREFFYCLRRELSTYPGAIPRDTSVCFDEIHSFLYQQEAHLLGLIMGFILDPEVTRDSKRRALKQFADKYCGENMCLDYSLDADPEILQAVKARMRTLAKDVFLPYDDREEYDKKEEENG